MASGMPDLSEFPSLPTEIRWDIYDLIFADLLDDAKPLDILLGRVPGAATLRSTCKFIYEDTQRSYVKAEALCNKKRQLITNTMVQHYQEFEDREDIEINWRVTNLSDLSRDIVSTDKWLCKHKCRKSLCYMCDDPAHRQCFHCGRNVMIPLYCKLHADPTIQNLLPSTAKDNATLPVLILSAGTMSSQHFTPMGRLITRLELAMECDIALKTKNYQSHFLWAYRWWHALLQDQRAIDTRCAIRRFAVRKHWDYVKSAPAKGLRVPAFCEANIHDLEMLDRRMDLVARLRMSICTTRGSIWREEYERRAKVEAESQGTDVALLIPPIQ